MKIGLIIPANMKYSPYVQYYTQILDKMKVEYKTIVWNKAGVHETVDYTFDFTCKDSDRKRVFLGYYMFACKCKRIIQKERFDRLILFTIAPAFFLKNILFKKYKNRYILDIRDDSPFRRIFGERLKKICKLAYEVVVSSDNYTSWTERNTILCHNADVDTISEYLDLPIKQYKSGPITIVFAGKMIEPDINIEVISQLKNKQDFILGFIGKPNSSKNKIEKFTNDNSIKNVWFEGTYKKEEIVDKYRSHADLINIFRANTLVNKNALPNKLYDAVLSGIPLVVFDHNEAIASYVNDYNLGIIIKESDLVDLGSVLKKGIEKFDYQKFSRGRKEFLVKVLNDQAYFEKRLSDFWQVNN